jgi:hypothetical protein
MGRPLHPEFPNESARERYARELQTQPRDVVTTSNDALQVDLVKPSDAASDASPAAITKPEGFEAVPPARGERRAKKPTAKKAKSKR